MELNLNDQIMGRLIETPQYLRELYYNNIARVITPLQIIFEEEDQRIEFDEQSVSRLLNFLQINPNMSDCIDILLDL